MKTETKQKRLSPQIERSRIYSHYMAKYFNLFLNRFKFDGPISDEAVAFLMRQFWQNGTVACFKVAGTEGSTEYPQGMPFFAPYAPTDFNLYNYPVKCTLIALRGSKVVPTGIQDVDKDVVIGWIQRNKEPILTVVDYYVRMIVNVEMVIQVNLNTQKFPWQEKSRRMAEMLLNDNPNLFIELDETDKAKALVSGAPYVIDKLYDYKSAKENELREYLGLNNLGVKEKKEHLLDKEVESKASGDVYLDCLDEFFGRIEKFLGISIKPSLNQPEPEPAEEATENEEEEKDD